MVRIDGIRRDDEASTALRVLFTVLADNFTHEMHEGVLANEPTNPIVKVKSAQSSMSS
jgi:hypothetical protein